MKKGDLVSVDGEGGYLLNWVSKWVAFVQKNGKERKVLRCELS